MDHAVCLHFDPTDVLVNNAAEQHCKPSILDISKEQLERTFRTNIFAFFYLTRTFGWLDLVCAVPGYSFVFIL